jgi:hypothetical protein
MSDSCITPAFLAPAASRYPLGDNFGVQPTVETTRSLARGRSGGVLGNKKAHRMLGGLVWWGMWARGTDRNVNYSGMLATSLIATSGATPLAVRKATEACLASRAVLYST